LDFSAVIFDSLLYVKNAATNRAILINAPTLFFPALLEDVDGFPDDEVDVDDDLPEVDPEVVGLAIPVRGMI
jgi:hypothetical protein